MWVQKWLISVHSTKPPGLCLCLCAYISMRYCFHSSNSKCMTTNVPTADRPALNQYLATVTVTKRKAKTWLCTHLSLAHSSFSQHFSLTASNSWMPSLFLCCPTSTLFLYFSCLPTLFSSSPPIPCPQGLRQWRSCFGNLTSSLLDEWQLKSIAWTQSVRCVETTNIIVVLPLAGAQA